MAGAAERRYTAGVVRTARREDPPAGSVSRSTVSRRCQEQMSALLAQLCARPLTEHYVALFVDGVHVGDQTIIVSLGVTLAGDKHVLGLWPGSTENTEVCRSTFSELADHGLTAEQGLLVVIDGSQALAAAAAATWNGRAVIQRCQAHKARHYQEKLPENKAPRILARVRRAWSQSDAVRAERRLRQIAGELEHQGHANAACSLREGLTETLTCVCLGLPPALCTSLETTNAIESAFVNNRPLGTPRHASPSPTDAP